MVAAAVVVIDDSGGGDGDGNGGGRGEPWSISLIEIGLAVSLGPLPPSSFIVSFHLSPDAPAFLPISGRSPGLFYTPL